jgi:hypothetical protein
MNAGFNVIVYNRTADKARSLVEAGALKATRMAKSGSMPPLIYYQSHNSFVLNDVISIACLSDFRLLLSFIIMYLQDYEILI